ncbi:MAG: hypothetical protein UZ14_CFX002000041 [Chloroflexi bacterium OLB14]|nr:MAG: hypothetical protein UZ14_CFX002000041 [Chloroflexi bacterium OLB14]
MISVFIGGGDHHSFPLIQYLPLYLLGIFVARHASWFSVKVYLVGALIGIGLLWLFITFEALQEFPPSAGWIVSAIGLLCGVSLLAKLIILKFPKMFIQYLNIVGQNVLSYLLLSNLFIMFTYSLLKRKPLNDVQIFLYIIAVLIVIFFIQWVSVDVKELIKAYAENE